MARTGKKPIDNPNGIIIIQASDEGLELKVSQELSYEQAKHLLFEALQLVGFYEESSCIPDNAVLQ